MPLLPFANSPGSATLNFSAGTTSSNLTNIVFSNANNISFGLNRSTVTASVSTSQSNQNLFLYALGNTTQSAATTLNASALSLNGLGSLYVGYSNSSINLSITQSNQILSMTATTNSVLASTMTVNASSLLLAGSGGASVGLSNGSIIVSAPNAAAGNVTISAGTVTGGYASIVFSNSNSVSFGLNGSTITGSASYTQSVQTQSLVNISAGTQLATSGSVIFSNSNNFSFGMSNSSIVTGSYSQTSQAAVNLAAGTQTATSGTVIFSNSNNVSFGMSNSSIVTASYTQSNQQMSFYAATNSVLSSSITANASSLVFAGSGAASVGLSSGSVIVSAPNAAAGNVTFSAGSLSGGYASIVFSNSNNMSFGLNGSTITGSVLPIGSLSRTIYPNDQLEAVSAFGNGSLSVQYIPSPGYVSGSRLDALVSWSASSSGASNTAAIAMTAFAGIYTNNASTLSSLSTGSTQTTYTYASNSANWSSINSAMLPISVPININMSPGEYYVGFGFSTNSSSIGLATTNLAQTVSMYGGTQIQSALNYAEWLAGTATSSNLFNMGVLNATATKPPATIALSQLSVTGQYLYRANIAIVIRNY